MRRILKEANHVSPRKAAFDDMDVENKKVRDYNKIAKDNNDDLDIIDDYQRLRLNNNINPNQISWRQDSRGRCISDKSCDDMGLTTFFYNTQNKKGQRDNLAKIIRGEKPRPQMMDIKDEPYNMRNFDNDYQDIDQAISSDIEALDFWNGY